MTREAEKIAKAAYTKDEKVAPFLATHAKRADSLPAKILVSALNSIGPKVALETTPKEDRGQEKEASSSRYGLYGFRAKTANLGLTSCSQIRESAGHMAADMHRRKADKHSLITGFLSEHAKQGNCLYSQILQASYPDSDRRIASLPEPKTVAEWLAWKRP
jgi:hypothetical protein